MRFAVFLASRILTYLLVMWIGITTVFFVPRFMPTDPVEAMLGRVQAQGGFMEVQQVEALRRSLTTAFGLEGTLWEQYVGFFRNILFERDFGPSLAMFPTPVSTLIAEALPWTLGLLLTATLFAWVLGNIIGLLAGYRDDRFYSKVLEAVAVIIYPIPYYILALVLIIFFAYLLPIFPMATSVRGIPGTLQFFQSVIHNSILPGISIVIVGFGWWVISMKALSSAIAEEDFVYFARLRGVRENRIMIDYVMRNAVLPQITALALMLGGIFNGALITEILFSYPGLGSLIHLAVLQSDYNLLMGAITLSVVAVATATMVIDLVYPFLDPRIRYK